MPFKRLVLIVFALLSVSPKSRSAGISWDGYYRVEGTDIRNVDLDGQEKNFLLHHMALKPRIIVKDDIIVRARFDVFNNQNYGVLSNQVGSFFGNPANAQAVTPKTFDNSDVIAQNLAVESVAATELYLTWLMNQSALLVGRVPKHFGMGLTHNAGNGDFDHWFDTHDVLAWKLVMGNHSFTPFYGKKSEGSVIDRADVNHFSFHYDYQNPDSDLRLGIFYEKTTSGKSIDTTETIFGGTPSGGYRPEQINVYLKQNYKWYDWEFEAGFINGSTGSRRNGQEVKFQSSGFISNLSFDFAQKFVLDGRFGFASGDKPDTTEFEGFLFDRNLDVAYLLFNHRLGRNLDLLGSDVGGASSDSVDTEYVGNTLFFAPRLSYMANDRWHYDVALVYARLNSINGLTQSRTLATEIDFGLSYRPNPAVHARLESGFLIPGQAFAGNTSNPLKNAFIISAKAAINF